MKHQRAVLALLSIATCSLVAVTGRTSVPAIHGTTATQNTARWKEYLAGGIQNRDTTNRMWLVPLNTFHDGFSCIDTSCGVVATITGGPNGASTAIAYAVTQEGAFTGASTMMATQGNFLEQKDLGTVPVPSGGHILLVATLVRATVTLGTDGGAMTSANLYRP